MEKGAGEFFLDGPKVLAVTEGYDLKISPLVPKLILLGFIGILRRLGKMSKEGVKKRNVRVS